MARRCTKPLRMWIDNKTYELKNFGKFELQDEKVLKDTYSIVLRQELNKSDFETSMEEDGSFSTTFRLPKWYYKQIHGNEHSSHLIRQLEKETNSKVLIPNFSADGNIKITSSDAEGLTVARHYIHSLIGDIREKATALQFVNIPLKSDEIMENFENFKKEILKDKNVDGIDESIFQRVEKLHLTVVVFSLFDDTENSEAIKTLEDYKVNYLDPMVKKNGPLKIKVEGINHMEQNPAKVNILYANAEIVDEQQERNLQEIVNEISDHFYEKGLVRRYQDNVKVHVTLMNTKYRKVCLKPYSPKNKWNMRRKPFDARKIMKKYKNYHFGTCNFNSVHLSLISSLGDDGFYKPISIINV